MFDRLVGVNQIAEILGVPVSWIYSRSRIKKGSDAIPCIRVGKYLKFRVDSVMEWLESQNERQS